VDAIAINPFIESIYEIFENMLGCQAQLGKPSRADLSPHSPDYIGVIGLTGTAQGIVALRLPEKTAIAVISRMAGFDFTKVDNSVIDGIGELVNMTAGSAKGKFHGHSISVSLPTVAQGGLCKLSNVKDSVWMEIPFESDLGAFSLIVNLKNSVEARQEVANESARG
jgi:chemotaxis protein CheX